MTTLVTWLKTERSLGEVSGLWARGIAEWETWMRAGGRPETTIYLRTYHMRRLAADFPDPSMVNTTVLAAWLAGHGWGVETLRSYRSSLRGYYGWAHLTGRIVEDPTRILPAVPAPHSKPRPTPDAVFMAAVCAADDRVRLMLRLAALAGLRRAEVAAVHTSDVFVDLDGGWSLRVLGKGRRTRLVPLGDQLAVEVLDRPAGWVFPSSNGGHLSPPYVGKLVSRRLGPGWTAHTLRHRFASRAYAADRDLRAVQELLGHTKLETTQTYTEIPSGAKRRAVEAAA